MKAEVVIKVTVRDMSTGEFVERSARFESAYPQSPFTSVFEEGVMGSAAMLTHKAIKAFLKQYYDGMRRASIIDEKV